MARLSLKDANWRWDDVQPRSEALFKSPHRLKLLLLISVAAPEELYAAAIAAHASIDNKEATRQFSDLVAANLLAHASRSQGKQGRGRPPELFERRDSEAWEAVRLLGDRFQQGGPSR